MFIADGFHCIADIPEEPTQVEQPAAGTSDVTVPGYQFEQCTPRVEVKLSRTLLIARHGSCLVAPPLLSGKVYYLRFEVQQYTAHPEEELLFGVTTKTTPADLQHESDAGWFVNRYSSVYVLTYGKRAHNAEWLGWRQGDQPVFKVDLQANMLHVRCASFAQDKSVTIVRPSQSAVYFYVRMHSANAGDLAVRLLPVSPMHRF